ncbi:MAG: hypothetical protein M1826_002520 [Phylliscum demangeonii]|nr:MAG: hypothetical protein M1826_002520 [Phylliscum demangeonii]
MRKELTTIQLQVGTGATLGPALINFAPPSVAGTGVALQAALTKASASDMAGLSAVILQIVLSSIPAARPQTGGVYIDDVVHTNHE